MVRSGVAGADDPPAALPAFPGAEGFGAAAAGGRGGRVIKVTNLQPSGPGSLQEACQAEGPRIVVFDTSGVIRGDVVIEHGQISIMGQTAPGAGITIQGKLLTRYGEKRYQDIVVRFLRVRPDPTTGASGDAIQFSRVENCVIDHVSAAWANDETIDIYNAHDVTIQWCAIEESDSTGHSKRVAHNFGMINGPGGGRISLHHTLFAHHRRRCPAIAHGPSDIRNILVYDFRDGLSHEGHVPNNLGFNIIANYYKAGPSDNNIFPFCFVPDVSYYLRDNYIEGPPQTYSGMIQDPWAEADSLYGLKYYAGKGVKAEREYDVPYVTTHRPQEAYDLVLDQAGCFPRDTVSRRTIEEVRTRGGSWGRHDPGNLMSGLAPHPHPPDGDNDGLPDSWERAKGLNSRDSSDYNTVMDSGYTAIEDYCNRLAHELVEHRGGLPMKGDLDNDGKCSLNDLLLMLKAIARQAAGDWAADLNYDNKVNTWDLPELLRLLVSR